MIHLFNKTEYSPFLQLSELNTQLSQTNQLKYAASAQPTQKSTAFTQLIRRSEKKTQHFYSFNAGLKKTQLLRSFFKKAAEKPAFTQLLRSFYAELRLILARVPTVYKRSAIVGITRINSLMTLPVLFGEEGKELFCTVSKKSKSYLPTLFFTGKEPETQLFFFLA